MKPRPELRLRTLRPLGAALLLALGACSTPLPTEPTGAGLPLAPVEVYEPLRQLGFQRTEEGWLLDLGAQSQFEFGSDSLGSEAMIKLHRIGRALVRLEFAHCRIEGHADEIGSEAFNQQLSERRAHAVARVLLAAGLPPERLQVQGFGKRRPIASNQTDAGRAQNRRVVLIVPAAG
ncbi:OmpA family protein [Inhella proteolytica]|uniref:OmpA family protein n=1 Tax=Inhella proteolytica TaxID=2795029 RepID=A0A931IZJ9_9BURK|nr:OmpA family protein [Inhella proteolytica]MBH9575380.1 OmpA family protein [Inhella proteolytica]